MERYIYVTKKILRRYVYEKGIYIERNLRKEIYTKRDVKKEWIILSKQYY